jgi:hypothetical protein
MQRDWPVRAPAQPDDVTLSDADQPFIGGQLAALYAQFESQFVGPRAASGNARRKGYGKCQKARMAEKNGNSVAHNSAHGALDD